jgi:hypothetical protein
VLAALSGDPADLRRMKRRATGPARADGAGLPGHLRPAGHDRDGLPAGRRPRPAWWAASPTGSPSPRCSGTRSGLRIPHTALVPRKKDELATKLGEFVTGHFLTPDAVVEQVAQTRLVRRVAERLASGETAGSVGADAAAAATALLDAVDERALTDQLLDLARRDLDRRSYTPVLGQFLARAVEGQGQRPLVDVCVSRTRLYLVTRREDLRPQLKAFLEAQGAVLWLLTTDNRVDTLILRAVELLGEVEADPQHELRRWLDGLLASWVDDLRYDAETARRVDAPAAGAARGPAPAGPAARGRDRRRRLGADLAGRGRRRPPAAPCPPGPGRRLAGPAGRGPGEPDRGAAAVRCALRRRELRQHRSWPSSRGPSPGWEAADASARIEAAVGRDLQFIRINGTVVGRSPGWSSTPVAVVLG